MFLKKIISQKLNPCNIYFNTCVYKTLNVSTDSSFEQIKTNYLKLVKIYHPDVADKNSI
jgi:DnaJ-class molecular chaperone